MDFDSLTPHTLIPQGDCTAEDLDQVSDALADLEKTLGALEPRQLTSTQRQGAAISTAATSLSDMLASRISVVAGLAAGALQRFQCNRTVLDVTGFQPDWISPDTTQGGAFEKVQGKSKK